MLEFDRVVRWTPWIPLEGSWGSSVVPREPGVYRIRRRGRPDLDYIGQTGMGRMTLRDRLGMLRGVFMEDMPYRDPHTAGPALWSLLAVTGEAFEVSVSPVQGTTPWREGLKSLAIALYRQKWSKSPTVNFGRMPIGYRMSSKAAKRLRGGVTSEKEPNHLPSISPAGPLTGDPTGSTWGGHAWSEWMPTQEAVPAIASGLCGLYRVRMPGTAELAYVGQGRVRSRVSAHLRKAQGADHRQAATFAAADLQWSWVLNQDWYPHQRLELATDLIASHLLVTAKVPAAQFLG